MVLSLINRGIDYNHLLSLTNCFVRSPSMFSKYFLYFLTSDNFDFSILIFNLFPFLQLNFLQRLEYPVFIYYFDNFGQTISMFDNFK